VYEDNQPKKRPEVLDRIVRTLNAGNITKGTKHRKMLLKPVTHNDLILK